MQIPAGALTNDVQVSVSPAPDVTPPAGATEAGTAEVLGPSGLQFAQPVTVLLEIDPTKLPAGKTAADIVVFTAPEGTDNYVPLPTTVADATHVAAQTTHFSVFVPTVPSDDAGAPGSNADAGCTAVLCGSYGPGTCGPQSDGCGGTLDCGQCADEDGGAAPDGGSCIPLTCANYQQSAGHPLCATYSDGCGGTLSCRNGCDAGTDGGSVAADAGGTETDGGSGASDAGGLGASDAGGIDLDGGSLAADASASRCGDGVVSGTETCDDGNTISGDGCSSSCVIEAGYVCPVAGQPCNKVVP